MTNNLDDRQITEIILSIIDPEDCFSIYNDDRNTRIWVKNMNKDEMKKCLEQLNEILLPLMSKPYSIIIDTSPDDSEF